VAGRVAADDCFVMADPSWQRFHLGDIVSVSGPWSSPDLASGSPGLAIDLPRLEKLRQ
jgi:hypothetical protein